MRKPGFLFFMLILLSQFSFGQSWSLVTEIEVQRRGTRTIIPQNYQLAKLDDQKMKEFLWKAPLESENNRSSNLVIDVMLADASIEKFRIVEYFMMEEGLRKKFPDTKTFYGVSVSDSFKSIRIDYTHLGFRAVVESLEGREYIDHYQQNDREYKIIYKKQELPNDEDWTCEVVDNGLIKNDNFNYRAGDCTFRTYRLACAATGEYTAFHGGTVGAGQAAVVTAFNRVNQIYEQDVNTRFILVANNDQLIFTNAATDPYTNNNGSTMLGENQIEIDGTIGSANYDIGHVFSTGGGGIASLRSLCDDGFKARGVTGQGSPTGDPFWIDYVAHEVGHQFGANHTQNNNCNRNSPTAMEPGSASTIMGYAGICSPNVQNNSDAYFHAISVQEMAAEVTLDECGQKPSGFENIPPVVSALNDYTVPHSTPLVLEAAATDSDDDPITYCWEQMDNQTASMPPLSTNTGGPAFRSLFPTSDNKRYLPSIDNVVNGTTDNWEVLPSVGRTMNWRVTVRDNALFPGCTDEEDLEVTIDGSSGPFIVSSFNTAMTVTEGQEVNITWDRANTHIAPVNCSNVDILWSLDGGLTYPITVLSGTPNDESEIITVPIGVTSSARVMIRGSNNIFFDINNADINVESGTPGYTMSLSPSSGNACQTDSEVFIVNTASINGFTTDINLSISGNPPGCSISIGSNPVTPGNNSSITLTNTNVATGSYNLTVTGNAGGMIKSEVFEFGVYASPQVPTLLSPADAATNVSINPTFSWNDANFASSYEYRIGTQQGGGGVVFSGTTSNTSISPGNLTQNTTYFWSVRSINSCDNSAWSNESSFTTKEEICQTYMSTDVPVTIAANKANTIISDLIVTEQGTITDINLVNLDITHTYVSDLQIKLLYPSTGNNGFYIIKQQCGSNEDIDINFDDEASSTFPCPMTDGGTYTPEFPLSAFDGLSINGQWRLVVEDLYRRDGGALNTWGIELCYVPLCDLTVTSTNGSGEGSLLDAINCAQPGETITLSNSLANSTINLNSNQMIIEKNLNIVATPGDNITVSFTGSDPALILNSGINLNLSGFTLSSNSVSSETILNNGNLTINNLNVIQSNGQEQIMNGMNSDLLVQGNCNLKNN